MGQEEWHCLLLSCLSWRWTAAKLSWTFATFRKPRKPMFQVSLAYFLIDAIFDSQLTDQVSWFEGKWKLGGSGFAPLPIKDYHDVWQTICYLKTNECF